MAKSNPPAHQPTQHFPNNERLFRRIHRTNIDKRGRATFLGFALPDMSVNRESFGTADDARRNHNATVWGVAAFLVAVIPPRELQTHNDQRYLLFARHVPEPDNFPHSEVRVWREVKGGHALVTERTQEGFNEGDPDAGEAHVPPTDEYLDPDFHMRWRKRLALASQLVIGPSPQEEE